MTVKQIQDMNQAIGQVLHGIGPHGALLEAPGSDGYALLPLDEDLLDYLLEKNPHFNDQCQTIKKRMQAGQFHSHDEVKKRLGL
jgi:hypothetical protein